MSLPKAALIALVAGLVVTAAPGCSNQSHVVDRSRALQAIEAIKADPHLRPAQKQGMIAEIQKQLN